MAWTAKGTASSFTALRRATGRAGARIHVPMIGFLLMGFVTLVCAADASPAAWEKANSPDSKADKKAAVDPGSLRTEETLIYPNDLVFIQVFDVEQMTREYRVSDTGTLAFPLLPEPVRASGLTPQQLAEVISRKCIEAGVLSHPQISVTVRESRIHAVAIAGAVRSPQIYPVFGRTTLLDVISQAGGVTDDAGSSVTITRGEVSRRLSASEAGSAAEAGKSPPTPPAVTVDLRQLLETGDPSSNIDVYAGDRVTVQRAGVVYVLGAVNNAGGFLLTSARGDVTVLKAVALANSLRTTAKGKKALILRPNSLAPGGRETIPVNLSAMLQGRVPDRPLRSNDILFVPDNTALKALHKSADVAVQTAGLAVLYK